MIFNRKAFICNVKGCGIKHYALGLCRKHWARYDRNGYTDKKKSIKVKGNCVICGKEYWYYAKQKAQTCSKICAKINMRERFLREKNIQWKGGIGDYPEHNLFKKNRKIVLEMSRYSCAICGTKRRKLMVHHKDFTKNNHDLKNLLPLCTPCHYKLHKDNGLE